MFQIAEGVTTVKDVKKLSTIYNVPMPITTEIYNVIYKNISPKKAVADLTSRKLKAE